jgi:hypothetical protein
MKAAIAHCLKRNANLKDLSYPPIQLTNMLQALIDNCCEIIEFTVLCNSNCPSCTDLIAPILSGSDNGCEIIEFKVLCNSNCPSCADMIAPCLE